MFNLRKFPAFWKNVSAAEEFHSLTSNSIFLAGKYVQWIYLLLCMAEFFRSTVKTRIDTALLIYCNLGVALPVVVMCMQLQDYE